MGDQRIYVASLSDYNGGILHGEWIDVEGLSVDDIDEKVQEILASSPYAAKYGERAEEWAIHDHEGFAPFEVGEWESFAQIVEWAEILQGHGEMLKAFKAAGGDIDYFDPQDPPLSFNGPNEADVALEYLETFHAEAYEALPDIIKYNLDTDGIMGWLSNEGWTWGRYGGEVYAFLVNG